MHFCDADHEITRMQQEDIGITSTIKKTFKIRAGHCSGRHYFWPEIASRSRTVSTLYGFGKSCSLSWKFFNHFWFWGSL